MWIVVDENIVEVAILRELLKDSDGDLKLEKAGCFTEKEMELKNLTFSPFFTNVGKFTNELNR